MTYFFLQFCFKGKLVVKDFYETLLSQKFILILFVFFSFNSYSQCSADAGPDTTKCAEQNVSIGGLIAGTGNGALIYSWSPAVGLSCADCPNPISSATVNTTYTLTVTDSVGCVSIDQVEVIIAADPNATFSFSPTGACSNFPVQFSPGSPAGIQSYQWSFGDPTSGGLNASSQQSPSHIFETFGNGSTTYSVELIATNAAGCKDTVIQNITVLQTPGAELIDPTNNFQNCTGSNFNMTVYNATVGSASQYTIIWGDGTANYSSSTFPSGGLTHLYNTADIFDLSYIVNGTNGCSDTVNYVVANITNPSIGIANPGGTIGCGPTTICFPLSSYSSNHISTIYVVNFGDGSSPVTYTHPPPSEVCHTYSTTSCGQPGNAFTLVIKASNFCDSSFSSVNPIKVYNGPTANFTVPTNRCVNTSVLFTNTSILGYNSTCSRFTTFTWNFGDGTPLLTLNQAILTNPSHTYTLPGTYTVTLTTSNPCSTTTHTAIVCIEVPPVPNFTLTNSINCVPFVPTISNTSTSLNTCSVTNTWSVIFNGSTCLPSTGSWNFSGGTTASSTQPQIQFVSPGTYTVRLTMVNSCGTYFVNQNTTGQAAPKITLNPLTSICAGTSTSPTATVNSCYESVDVYNWTLTGGTPSSSSLAVPGPVVYPTAGSYTVLLQATNGCGTTSASTPLTVTAPPIANAGNNVQFCSGGNSPIGSASTAGVTYSWSPSTGLSSGTAANPTLTLTNLTGSPIINSYIVTATTTPGCFSKDTVLVTVNPNPVLTVNSPTICFGETASLLVDGAEVGGTYNWNSSPSLSCLNCPNPTASPSATTTYTVIGTNTYGCTTTITSIVTVNALPTTNAGLDNTICLGSSATLTAIGANTYTWSPSTYLNTTAGNSVISTPLTTIQYVVTGTAVNGCTKNDTVNVIVQEPAFVDANSDQVVCALGAVTLNGSIGGSATTSTWTASSGTFSNATSLTSTYTPSITSGNVTLTLTTNDPSGPCLVVNDQVIITVSPQPTIISNNASICVGENAILTATGAGVGGSYNWTASPTLNCTACESAVATPVNTTTYTISGTNSLGCSNTSTALVTVNPLPVVSAGADVTLCDQPITYTFVGSPSGGIWSGSPNITNAGVFTPNGGETSNLQYFYTNPLTGCQNSDTVAVTVTPAAIPTAIPTYSICVNNAAVNLNTVLSSTPAGGTWSGAGVTNPTFTPSVAGVGTHTVTYSIGAGTCLATVTSSITVNPQPTISSNNATICVGQSANLTASGTGDPSLYNWIASPSLSCTACQTTTASPITTTSYSVSGTSSLGCTNTTNATVTVNPRPIVSAGADVSLCDQPITYTFVGTPAGGIWSGSPNITSSGVFTPNGTETSNLQYLYTNPLTGCQNSDTVAVTVTPAAIPTAIPTYSICVNNAAVNLNAVLSSTPAGGTWSGTGVTNPTFTPSASGVGTYTVTYSIGAGTCLATVTSSITVNPQPTISSNNATICAGQSATLNATGAGVGGTYNWTASPTLSCTACQSAIATPITTTSYSVSGTTSFGCTNTTTTTVAVNPLPVVNAGSDTTLCDQPIAYTFIGSPSGGTWSGSPNITGAGVFTPNGSEVTTLTYTYVNPSTGCQNSDNAVVTVTPPIIPIAIPTYSICVNNAAVNLNTVLSSTPAGGTWSGTGVTNPTFTPSIAGVGIYSVTYSIGAGTCLATVTSAITVNPQPTISANNATICVGQSAALNATGAGVGGTYNWTASPSLSCTACQSAIATPVSNTTYTVSGTTSFGCSNTGTAQVTVNPLPIVNAGNDTTLCDQPIPVQMTGTIAGGSWSGPSISPTGLFTPAGTGTYSITYTVVLGTGCTNFDVKIITVISRTLSNAGNDQTVCVGNPSIAITGLPAGGSWSGPGISPAGVFTPSSSGVFGLIYTLGVGNCLTRDTMNFTVNALPIVSAGPDQSFCLSDNSLNFIGNPSGGTWSGTGITNNVSGTFDPAIAGVGVHTIVYTYSDPLTSCLNRDTLLSTVHPLPSVSFNYNTIICQGVAETFTNTSTFVAASQWDFGDGVTASSFSGTHTYSAPGFYDIQLIVTSPFGCVDSLTQSVEVRSAPFADFSIAIDSACGTLVTTFNNISSGSGPSYNWQMGNGQTSSSFNPGAQSYSAALGIDTTYYVQLTVTNNCGASSYLDSIIVMPQPIAFFGTNVNSGCSPLLLSMANLSSGLPDSYFWDFGNGSTSTSSANLIQETFVTGNTSSTYTISLVVQNECGVDSTSNSITVFPNTVTAFFNSSVTTGCENLTVNFTQFSIGGTFYNWDFGDNNTSTQLNPTHTFMNPGTYDVTLFVNDGCAFDTMVTSIVVNPAPQVNFSVAPDSVCINEPFTFTNLSSNLANSFWTFGDGGTSGLTDPQYAYSQPGNYSVTLVGASLTNGCVDSVIQIVQVSQNSISSFTANALSGCVPFNVQFTNSSSNAAYQSWNFGDGNSSTAISPGHIFTVPGTYEVQLITESTSGCSDTSIVSITVHPVPVSNFTFVSSNTCYTPVVVTMTNTSTGAINYSWDFGNGQTSSNTNTSVTYTNPGTYLISLVAENQYGCQAEYNETITVYPTPVAQFQLPASVACANDVLFFESESLFADSVNWIMGDGSILSGTPVNYAYTNPGNYFITLIAFGAGGCGDTLVSNFSITINPDPVANFEYVNVQIPDPLNGTVEFTNLSQGATNYMWFFANDTTSTETNPIHQFYNYGTYNTTLVAINEFGCTDTIAMDIVVDFFNGLFLPNAIYPGSGIFEISHFVPKGVGLKEYELLIYDDWGNLIWQTTALDINGRPSEFWDGTFNGVPVQQDAYVWKVRAVFLDNAIWEGNDMKTNKIKRSGTVTVIR